MEIKFGPSGKDELFFQSGYADDIDIPSWLQSLGLNFFEFSFGRGFQMKHETAIKLGEEFEKYKIGVSVHAPYFVNLANPDNEMVLKSLKYILTGIKFLSWLKSNKMVIHVGSVGKTDRSNALKLVADRLKYSLEVIHKETSIDGKFLCLETMGKNGQIGTYKEIVDLCKEDSCLLPTFDFGHINAITQGSLKAKEDYAKVFDYSFENLGEFKTKNCHIHFSKIEYGLKGEIKHLNFDDTKFGPLFEPLCEYIIDKNLTPTIVCESASHAASDALYMKNTYESFLNKKFY